MRIFELTGYKNNPEYIKLTNNPNFMQFAKQAKEKGWKLYGEGGSGAVLKHPNKNFVYKIFGGSVKFNKSGYLGYLNFILKNKNNPYVPNVGKPIKIPNTASGPTTGPAAWKTEVLYFVRMEILDEPKGYNDPRFKKYISPKYDKNMKLSPHDDPHDYGEEADTLYHQAMESLYQTDKKWRAIVKYAGDEIDIGINNLMFRGDQLIFIDPMMG